MKREGRGRPGEPREQPAGAQAAAEDREDQAWLQARERGDAPLPHIDPQRAESYQRIEEALSDLPELEPPEGWELVVRAELDALEHAQREKKASPAAPTSAGAPDEPEEREEREGHEERREPWMAAGTNAQRPLAALGDFAPLGGTDEIHAVAVELPASAPLLHPRQPQATSLRRESERPPRDPFRLLWIPAAGALAMAAGVLLLVFRVGASPAEVEPSRGGSDDSAPQVTAAASGAARPAPIAAASGADPGAKSIAPLTLRAEIKSSPGQAPRRGSPRGDAALGDLFTIDFTSRPGQLRLYLDRREIARCPGAPACALEERSAQLRFQLTYPMDAPGEYRAVYFEGAGMDAPSEGLDKDLTRCRRLDEQAPASARPVCSWQMAAAHEVK